ncbi:restriction endonuclease subunit S [Lactiplantibacillus plantarum]|uniref:restriction endonuclease subunit S n=1 Tax=Lactiplantibacillus plantarum TaxID=1590 RepID=UPI000931D362|nr:restriction endonuclease subunit S [Lactiplantibacillus plantarum]
METKLVKLGDIISLNYGKSLTKKNRIPGDVPVYGSSGITDYHNKPLVDAPSLIIGRKGSIGSVFLSEVPFYPIDTTYFAKESDLNGLDLHFAYYFLKFLPLSEMNTDSAIPGLNRNNFYSLDVVIPDIKSQKIIAFLLDQISYKIKINQQINKNLLKLGMNIAIRTPNINKCTTCRISDMKDFLTVSDHVANGSFKTLKDNVTIVDKPDYSLFLRNTDLKRNLMGDKRWITKHSYDFLKKSHLYGGEVIISNVGDVGSVHRVPYLDEHMVAGNNVIFIQSADSWITDYLYLYFLSNIGQHALSTITSGSAQQKFNKTDFRAIELPIIPKNFVKKNLTPILKKIDSNRVEEDCLITLRDLLLPRLLSGEIDLSIFEEVLKNAK